MHYQFNEKSLMFGKNGHWGLFWKMDVPYQLAPSSIIWKILGPKISSRQFAMPQNYKRVWKQSWTQILLQWKETIGYKSRQLLKNPSFRVYLSWALRSNFYKSEKFVKVDMVHSTEFSQYFRIFEMALYLWW